MHSAITIDGSLGEGGGQILRSSLALSVITQRPVRFERIRAGRAKPGLARQHLTAVRAAAAISGARVEGDELRSTSLTFSPAGLHAGVYRFAVGSAGSTTLVLQTVLWPLLVASGDSEVAVEGGTHNPMAPTFEAMDESLLPLLRRMGARLELEIPNTGFCPAGGGRLVARIGGSTQWSALQLSQRGEIRERSARALFANLPVGVARRELAEVARRLDWSPSKLRCDRRDSDGPGNALVLRIDAEHTTTIVSEIGSRGVSAERVAAAACRRMQAFIDADVPVDAHTADQLLLPMALAGGGGFTTVAPTDHTTTNAKIIERFLPVRIDIESIDRLRHRIEVKSRE